MSSAHANWLISGARTLQALITKRSSPLRICRVWGSEIQNHVRIAFPKTSLNAMVSELDLHGQLRDSGFHAQNTTASLFLEWGTEQTQSWLEQPRSYVTFEPKSPHKAKRPAV